MVVGGCDDHPPSFCRASTQPAENNDFLTNMRATIYFLIASFQVGGNGSLYEQLQTALGSTAILDK